LNKGVLEILQVLQTGLSGEKVVEERVWMDDGGGWDEEISC